MVRGTFFGFEIAKRGLAVSQRQLDVTAHNLANVNTEGYTRQRMVTTAIDPASGGVRFASLAKGMVGRGVETVFVDQIRSKYVDKQIRGETSVLFEWSTKAQTYSYIEVMFNESTDRLSNINEMISNFFNSFADLSTQNAEVGLRSNVRNTAQMLISGLNRLYKQLSDKQDEMNDQMKVQVDNINSITERIAKLNAQIYTFELNGEHANDLRDKRNLLIDELASITDIAYEYEYVEVQGSKTSSYSALKIYLGKEAGNGAPLLVDHKNSNELKIEATYTDPITGKSGLNRIVDTNGVDIEGFINSGEIKAYIDMCRGVGGKGAEDTEILDAFGKLGTDLPNDYAGIPSIIYNLNILAKSIVEEVNQIHKDGWTMPFTDDAEPDTPNGSKTGINFFDPSGITIATIKLSNDILNSERNIAASDKPIDFTIDPTKGSNNADNNIMANKIYELLQRTDLINSGEFMGYLKTIVTNVAIETKKAKSYTEGQRDVIYNLEDWRASISSVSIDEEMADLIRFQHAYSASSRMINAMDEQLDILINKTGLVGR